MATDFAVVKINSKQHLVAKNDRLKVDSVSKDSVIEVMMVGNGDTLTFGEPILSDFGVKFEVLSEGKDKKLVVRRYKSKSRYRKNKGHRQPVATLKVVDFGKNVKNELVWEEAKPAKVEEPKAETKEVEAKEVKPVKKAVKSAK
jgi:large subunit ribosomal protein L21